MEFSKLYKLNITNDTKIEVSKSTNNSLFLLI